MSTIHRRTLAYAAIVAQVIFVGGWLVLGLVEGHGYAPGRDDISDLGALTAHHATADRITLLVAGSVTIAFALSLHAWFGRTAWWVALSLPGLDSLSDAFFRLDCRAADAGCDASDATSSWHGKVHLAVFVVSALATVIAPFLLARRMRSVEAWADLAGPTRAFGFVVIAVLVATGAATGTAAQGWAQRGAAAITVAGLALLAAKVARLEGSGYSVDSALTEAEPI